MCTAVPRKSTLHMKLTGTVSAADPFNPAADAETLKNAMEGFGTDAKAIINMLARRRNKQRLEIAQHFKTLCGKNLIDDLKSKLEGNLEKVILAMMMPAAEYYATCLYKAISGAGTDEDVLVEIMCTMNNYHIKLIRETYEKMYGNSLEDDLKGDTSDTFKRLMVSQCSAAKDRIFGLQIDQAIADAQALADAVKGQWCTDESTFNMILCQRSFPQVQATFDEYQKITGKDIEDDIKREFCGNGEDGVLAVVEFTKNPAAIYAKRLHKSMAGLVTNHDQLIGLIVSRCEFDMEDIKAEYEKIYGKSLEEAIKRGCSGDYKECLLVLTGHE